MEKNKFMSKKCIVKFSDLKYYKWASDIDFNASDILLKKLSSLGIKSRIYFRGDASFWIHHRTLIFSLMLIQDLVLSKFKDFIILDADEFYMFQQGAYENSEALLLSCLKDLSHYWIGLLPIFAEFKKYYHEYKGDFGELEYRFLDIWLGILPAMDEIIILLTKKNSVFTFKSITDSEYKLSHFTISLINPLLPTDDVFKTTSLMVSSKTKLVRQAILGSLLSKDDSKDLLYSWLQVKLEYKFRIKNLTETEAIKLFVTEVFMDLDLETIRFLCVNQVLDLDYLRQMALEHAAQINK